MTLWHMQPKTSRSTSLTIMPLNHGFASLHKQIAPIQAQRKCTGTSVVLVLEEILRTIEARERSEEKEVVRTWPRNSIRNGVLEEIMRTRSTGAF